MELRASCHPEMQSADLPASSPWEIVAEAQRLCSFRQYCPFQVGKQTDPRPRLSYSPILAGVGNSSVNCVPTPTSLCTSIRPPWASIMRRAVGSPSPLPPLLVV